MNTYHNDPEFAQELEGLMNAHMITLRTEPIAHKTIFKCIDDPDFGEEWMQALFFQYDKNAAITLMAQPAQQEEVPEGH